MAISDQWKSKSLFLSCVLMFIGAAIYNGYPLVTSDTGTYINSAYTLEVARDRPFGYSILIAVTSLSFSLWLTVVAQAILLTYLCKRIVKIVLPDHRQSIVLFSLVAFLALFTTASWFVSMIMPDLFTAIATLAGFLFLVETNKKHRLACLIIFLYAITTHTSHLLIFSILGVALSLVNHFFGDQQTRKYLTFALICFSGWLIVPGLHWIVGGQFSATKSTHVFMTGRLIETGTLQRYLRKSCPSEEIPLCAYSDQLPNTAIEFIWNGDSPLYQTDGWEDSNGQYRKMVRQIMTRPKYLFQFLYSSFWSSMTQLTQTHVGDGLQPHVEESNPFWKVQQYYKYELPVYLNNLQNQNNLTYQSSNTRYRWVVILSVFILSLLYFSGKLKHHVEIKIVIFVALAIVINAFVTATFGNVLGRLQSRIIWLLPMVTFLLTIKHYGDFRASVLK